jgi:hypothetical protein
LPDRGAQDADQLVEVDVLGDHDLPRAAPPVGEVMQDHPGGEPLRTQLAQLRRGERPVAEPQLELGQPVVRLAAPI